MTEVSRVLATVEVGRRTLRKDGMMEEKGS